MDAKEFDIIVRPVIKWLCDNGHPHMTIIITPVSAELMSGELSTGMILDYVKD